MDKLKEIFLPLMDNIYVYIFVSFLLYFLGGFDESIIVLFCLNIIDILLNISSNPCCTKGIIISKLKIYLVISVGVMLDRLLGIENNPTTKARTYIILAYSYNEIANIINLLCSDEKFFVPKGIRHYMSRLNKKGVGKSEQFKQKK